MKLPITTIVYLEENDKYLMLYRNKKKKDINKGKWIGIGGHIENGESPEDCILREMKEETGLTLTRYQIRGIVTFLFGEYTEYMHVFSADQFQGELISCEEGELQWVSKKEVYALPMWEGDPIILRLLETRNDYFSLKLTYTKEGSLQNAILDGKPLEV